VRRKRLWAAAALLLLGLGGWQAGQGLYIHAKALLAQYLLHQAWARTLAGEREVKPWPWADTWPVARLRVPAKGVDLIVLAGASGRTLAFGPGLLDGTASPGSPGNSLISGHRDTHFRFLKGLGGGDEILIGSADGRTRRYRTVGSQVIDGRKARIAVDTEDAYLTLVTCYPFDAVVPGGPLRYVVTARGV
jgi:sortase A